MHCHPGRDSGTEYSCQSPASPSSLLLPRNTIVITVIRPLLVFSVAAKPLIPYRVFPCINAFSLLFASDRLTGSWLADACQI